MFTVQVEYKLKIYQLVVIYQLQLGGNVNWYSHYGRQYGDFLKN